MDPADPAELHYRLAKHLLQLGQDREAERQVLMALEEAPRFRDAHRLLLNIVEGPEKRTADPVPDVGQEPTGQGAGDKKTEGDRKGEK